jgi:hypothetical protein
MEEGGKMKTELIKIKKLLEKFYNQSTLSAQEAHDLYNWAYGQYLKEVKADEEFRANNKGNRWQKRSN